MKGEYRGCDIEVYRDKSLAGYSMLFFSIFHNDYEVTSGFSEGEDKVKDYFECLKVNVDEYLDEIHS